MALEANDHDNRGTAEHPFGFIYFNDGTRVGYGRGHGVWAGNWGGNSSAHIQLAYAYLKGKGIEIFKKQ